MFQSSSRRRNLSSAWQNKPRAKLSIAFSLFAMLTIWRAGLSSIATTKKTQQQGRDREGVVEWLVICISYLFRAFSQSYKPIYTITEKGRLQVAKLF